VESSINTVEAKIFELNFQSGEGATRRDRAAAEAALHAKRAAWLDLTYLRNSIITWTTQLLVMAEHASVLNERTFALQDRYSTLSAGAESTAISRTSSQRTHVEAGPFLANESSRSPSPESQTADKGLIQWQTDNSTTSCDVDQIVAYVERMRLLGHKFQSRLDVIRDDYDEKVRDCTMRTEGMAMATQWVSCQLILFSNSSLTFAVQ
jgi:hypothetical protein